MATLTQEPLLCSKQLWRLICSIRPRMEMRPEQFVFWVFLVGQVLDGALTYIGVKQFGIGVEMNELLANYMQLFGAGPTLIGAKTLACACGVILYFNAAYRSVAVAAGAQVGFAVIPWVFTLVTVR
jgi:hypothetical protein